MSEQERPSESISALELRRRLMSAEPPGAAETAVAAAPGAGAPSRRSGTIANALSRLTMPGANGPVAATDLPPTTIAVDDLPGYPSGLARRNLDKPSGGSHYSLPGMNDSTPGTTIPMQGMPLAPGSSGTAGARQHTEDDYRRVKQENRELRKLLDEMKMLLQEASDNEQKHSNHEQELKDQLELKQRQIDELTNQLQSIEEQVASGALTQAPPTPKTKTELEEWSDELEQEASRIAQIKRTIEQERQQLREDEESLEHQMRDMEVSMARERALMARQETELKRLSAEIQHELELMQRGDVTLREQMSKFQRRAADVLQTRPGAGNGSNTSAGGRR